MDQFGHRHIHRNIYAQVHTVVHRWGVIMEPWFHVRSLSPITWMILERVLNHSGPLVPLLSTGNIKECE